MALPPATVLLGIACGVVAWTLAAIVLAASRTKGNRWLAALLVAEGALQATVVLGDHYSLPVAIEFIGLMAFPIAAALVYPVLAGLETPMTRAFRRPGPRYAVFALGGIYIVLGIIGEWRGVFNHDTGLLATLTTSSMIEQHFDVGTRQL